MDPAAHDRARILQAAGAFLAEPPITITAFKAEHSAGGIHDYFSQADYSWPDPAKADGLPYVNRDGWSNPDTLTRHRWAMVRLARGVGALGAAFKITGDRRYAEHGLAHLRAWFVTPGDDLWAFTLPDGRSLRKAVAFMFPSIADKSRWTLPRDVMFFEYWPVRHASLLFAGLAYREAKYIELWKRLPADPVLTEIQRNMPVRFPVLWVD